MFKFTMEENFERDWPLIKAKFTSLRQTKSGYFFGTPGTFLEEKIIFGTTFERRISWTQEKFIANYVGIEEKPKTSKRPPVSSKDLMLHCSSNSAVLGWNNLILIQKCSKLFSFESHGYQGLSSTFFRDSYKVQKAESTQ